MWAVSRTNALFLVIALFAVLAYAPHLGVRVLDQANSASYAVLARDLVVSGAFLPFGHPPLAVLLLAVSFAFFGSTEFAARLVVLAFFVVGGAYTFRLSGLLHSARAGLLASLLYFLSPLLLRGVFGYWMDVFLMVFILASVYHLCEYSRSRSRGSFLYGAAFAVLAVLTKEAALLLLPAYLFVFRGDGRVRGLCSVMLLSAVAWLAAYELMLPGSYDYNLLYNVDTFFNAEAARAPLSSSSNFFDFLRELGPVVFVFAVIGGEWLFRKGAKLAILPFLVAFGVLGLSYVSRTASVRYFFPAVPLLFVFASVAFAESWLLAQRGKLVAWLAVVLCVYAVGSYAFSFFGRLEGSSAGWAGSPRQSLLDFVLRETAPADSLAVIDERDPGWLSFYSGRRVYAFSVYSPAGVVSASVRGLSPDYLVVRNAGLEGLAFGNCSSPQALVGRSYNYTVYACDWR